LNQPTEMINQNLFQKWKLSNIRFQSTKGSKLVSNQIKDREMCKNCNSRALKKQVYKWFISLLKWPKCSNFLDNVFLLEEVNEFWVYSSCWLVELCFHRETVRLNESNKRTINQEIFSYWIGDQISFKISKNEQQVLIESDDLSFCFSKFGFKDWLQPCWDGRRKVLFFLYSFELFSLYYFKSKNFFLQK
jgi:hypothetical protein